MKKSIILVVVLASLSIGLYLLNQSIETSDEKYIESYLEDDGFVYDEDGQFYKKVKTNNTMSEYFEKVSNDENSEYEELYFYMGSYKILKVKMKYENKYNTSYTVDYNLVDKTVSYKYEATVYSSSMLVGGSYNFNSDNNNDSVTCELISDRDMGEDYVDLFCSRAKYETLLFIEEVEDLISTPRFEEILNEANLELMSK